MLELMAILYCMGVCIDMCARIFTDVQMSITFWIYWHADLCIGPAYLVLC